EVDAAEAVHLQVDEAGDRDPAPAQSAQADRRDPAVLHLDVPLDQEAVDERRFDSELHALQSRSGPGLWSIPVVEISVRRACVHPIWSIPSPRGGDPARPGDQGVWR